MSTKRDELALYDETRRRLRESLAGQLPADVDMESVVTSYAYWVCTVTGRSWEQALSDFADAARRRAAEECRAERREEALVQRELAQASGLLLDVGAGWGRMAPIYRDLGLRAVCIEPEMLGARLMRRDGIPAVVRAVGESLPFAAGAFSAALLGWVLHHNSAELDAAAILVQMARVLAPGGLLISIEPLGKEFDLVAWMGLLEGAGFTVSRTEQFSEVLTSRGEPSYYTLAVAIRRASS